MCLQHTNCNYAKTDNLADIINSSQAHGNLPSVHSEKKKKKSLDFLPYSKGLQCAHSSIVILLVFTVSHIHTHKHTDLAVSDEECGYNEAQG